ncbi:MAG: DnaA/Hda family protein [Rickettsiaceae bacterium]|nr:DnaA/Hda family protein [Rickettsiaceae bacterium]
MRDLNELNIRDKSFLQEILAIKTIDNCNLEDFFISPANKDAYEAAISSVIGVKPYENILLIEGAKSSGKTLLAAVLASRNNGSIIKNANQIHNNSLLAIIDDADLLGEEEVFHIFNTCSNQNIKLIIFAKANWQISLADLRSRINSIKKISIKEPDDELIKIIISREFSKRSIFVNEKIIEYLASRLDRNFASLLAQIEEIDQFCLANKKNLSLKSVHEWMRGLT